MAVASSARAQHAIELFSLGAAKVRVDGDLREWRGPRFVELGDEEDSSLEYAVGYDAEALYVAARVFDDELVRTSEPGPDEDAVVLTLALPRASGKPRTLELWLYAGVMGKQASSAALGARGARPSATEAISVVEGPLPGAEGYVLEARVPLRLLEGGENLFVGRGAIRLQDVDGKPGARPNVLASMSAARGALPPLLGSGTPNGAVESFLRAKGLPSGGLRHDYVADASGDERLERVVVAGTFVVLAGPDTGKGTGFRFMDLPVAFSGGVLDAKVRDLTGDGKVELLVRLRQQNELGARDVVQVLDLLHDPAKWLFTLELRKETSAGSVEASFELRPGKPPLLVTRIGAAEGLAAGNYRETPARGVEPILLPWGEVASRTYRWDGTRFVMLEQEPNRDAIEARERSEREPAASAQPVADGAPQPAPAGADELVEAFREARGIPPSVQARFEQHANVAEDARLESLMLFGKDLLVIGKGYRGGKGYLYYGLPVRDGSEILRMFTGDVSGDGRRELFVRHRQLIGDVQREILLAYTFTETGMEQVLAVEVRRTQGERSVSNEVELVKSGKQQALVIAPGRARGWDAASYPFVADSGDGYAPLLLPWKHRAARYRWNGRELAPD
jgi:hypothetical protein